MNTKTTTLSGLSLAIASSGKEAVWAVRDLADDRLVGSTRFLAIEPAHRRDDAADRPEDRLGDLVQHPP